MAMGSFAENLQGLSPCEEIAALELRDGRGELCGVIENKPGSAGSVRVYAYLAKKWGGITADAAREGLDLYAEHTEDARRNPGKHPNIDRLLQVLTQGAHYQVELLSR
jgi:hypothetical protein